MMFELVVADFERLLRTVLGKPVLEGAATIQPTVLYYDATDYIKLYINIDGVTYVTTYLRNEQFNEDQFKLDILGSYNALELTKQPNEHAVNLRLTAE